MGIICTHVVSPRARGKIILATGNQNFSLGMDIGRGTHAVNEVIYKVNCFTCKINNTTKQQLEVLSFHWCVHLANIT